MPTIRGDSVGARVADNPDERIDPLCGRRLGDFVLRERIDDGGFGAVYRCDQPKLRREVVVKVAHQRASASDPEALRFLREAQLASRLDHPFAAHVYAFGIEPDDGLVWIAMEMVHGTTLDRWLAGHTELRPDARRELLVPLFEGLADVVHVAHAAGIVHRDIKPSNIMVSSAQGSSCQNCSTSASPNLSTTRCRRPQTARRSPASRTRTQRADFDVQQCPSRSR